MQAYLTVKKQGTTVINQKSKSFLIGFCGLMIRQWCQDTDTLNDTGGNSHSSGQGTGIFGCRTFAGYGLTRDHIDASNDMEADRCGIVIGSGTGMVAPDDYSLGTQIRSGEKAGTILYCGMVVYGLTIDAGTDQGSFKIMALFKNISGGSIDVKEVGLYMQGQRGAQSYPNVFGYCVLRDNITTVPLADGEFLEVEYTISIST
ncbi:MAG: hypothetical protein HWN68_10000 [Desulfobacterales bacterium]|nr:hypothetical protein [Desulfobacterales bacterium]